MMKILAFGASNHSHSINAAFANFAAERFKAKFQPDVEIQSLDINDYEMPIYSLDREQADGVHELAQAFFAKIGAADSLIISFAEYNGSYSSAWKNIHDWMSRIKAEIYQGKPMVALAATPGPRAGAGVLQAFAQAAPFFGADVRGQVGVGRWSEAFDPEQGTLTNADDLAALDAALARLTGEPA